MTSLGTGGVETDYDKIVVHFGSPSGTQFGAASAFQDKHPDFILK